VQSGSQWLEDLAVETKESDVVGNSVTKTQKNVTTKRSLSHNKKIARKLLLDEGTGYEDDGCAE